MIDEQYEKAKVLDQLISDIRNGVVKIVPCEPTEPMQVAGADGIEYENPFLLTSANNSYEAMLSASPIYEPIKQFLGDEK